MANSIYHFWKYIDFGNQNFVIIDGVQMCTDFEKAMNGLHAMDKYRIEGGIAGSYLYKDQVAKYDYKAKWMPPSKFREASMMKS